MNKTGCQNFKIFKTIESSIDRVNEAAWFIRLMEHHYHDADRFRWSLNSFLRTLKEVLQVVTMETQHKKELSAWLREQKSEIQNDPVISFLFKQRDIVVHKAMLKPSSKGTVGFTRGRGLKLGMGMPIDPLADSKDAILKYIHFAARNSDFLGILYTEDDGGGEYTCVQREWRLHQFADKELTVLAARAWESVAKLTYQTAERLGAKVIQPTFELGHPNQVQFEIYRPEWIREQLHKAQAQAQAQAQVANKN